jgi:hypothetical protein
MGVWVPGLAGLRGTGLWNEYCAGLCRPWGCGPVDGDCLGLYLQHSRPWGCVLAEQRSCRAVQALEVWWAKQRSCRAGGAVQPDGAPAGLCWPWGLGPAQWKSCMFVSPARLVLVCGPAEQRWCRAVQAWGRCGLAEIINVCGSLSLNSHS